MSPWANLTGEGARPRRQIITEDERPQPVEGHEEAWTEREEDDAAFECAHRRSSRIGRSNWHFEQIALVAGGQSTLAFDAVSCIYLSHDVKRRLVVTWRRYFGCVSPAPWRRPPV
jgi:hypothetical protein